MVDSPPSIDPCEWYGRMQRSYLAAADETTLDELTDIGRLLAVIGYPPEFVVETHGTVLSAELARAPRDRHDELVQAAATCLSQVMVAWRVAAESLDDASGPTPAQAEPALFLPFDRDGCLTAKGESLTRRLERLGAAARGAEVAEAIRQRRLMTFDIRPAEQAGQVLRATVCPFRDGSGLFCLHDVTARRAAEDAVFQRRKLASLGQLAGGIAHEINNLLQPILTSAQFILEDHGDDGELAADAQVILDSARAAAGVVRDVLAFARRGGSNLVPLCLGEVVTAEMALVRRMCPAGVTITVAAGDRTLVRANAGEIAQVLRNLVGNAVDAMGGNPGTVTVSVDPVVVNGVQAVRQQVPPGRYARLSVADDGPGLPPGTAEHIFEPFFTTKPIGHGTGLGLAIVQGIVRGWCGTIAVRPAPGRGTVFDILLPLEEQTGGTEAAETRDPAERGGAARIVVVDDDPRVRAVVVRALERAGHRVRAFASAEEALPHLCRTDTVDLLVSDWVMPGMDGLTFLKEARRNNAHLPVVVLTGGGSQRPQGESVRHQISQADSACHVLLKPVSADELCATVARCLERAGHENNREKPVERQESKR